MQLNCKEMGDLPGWSALLKTKKMFQHFLALTVFDFETQISSCQKT